MSALVGTMYVRNVEITDIKLESANIATIFFDYTFHFVPGQYVMCWIRGVDEIPMSLSYNNGVTVKKVGEATAALLELRVGDTFGIRGPLGHGFLAATSPTLLVAGGVGAAPLAPYAEALHTKVVTMLGAKTQDELLFVERFKSAGRLLTATDDGSAGHAGSVVELLAQAQGHHQIACCGPERMMKQVLEHAVALKVPSQFSLHRYIKCGVGLCGSCCIDHSGLRTCVEGPVFTGEQLRESEFGKYMRSASGSKVNL